MESLDSWPRQHRLTANEYYRMAEVGLLAPEARIELIEGVIFDMAPIGKDHNGAVTRLTHLFVNAVANHGVVRVQMPLRLDEYTVPEPDIAILAPNADYYSQVEPTPADVLLLIEVSDSSLDYDCSRKVPLYARHGIPEVWIADLKHRELRTYRSPQNGAYADQRVTARPGVVESVALPGVGIDLSGLWPG